jgi:uncharacterized protein (TIGR02246 family)
LPPTTLSKSATDRLNVALDSAFRAGSSAEVAAQFTPDAVLSLVGVPDVRGRVEINALLTPLFAANVVAEHRLTATEIEAYDSVSYERGTFTWAAAPRGEVARVEHGRYSLVRRRTSDGRWLIHRFLENLVPHHDPTSGAATGAG